MTKKISSIILEAHDLIVNTAFVLPCPKEENVEVVIIKNAFAPYSYFFNVRAIRWSYNGEGNRIDEIVHDEHISSDAKLVEVLESFGFKGFGFFNRDYFMSR